LLELFLVTFLVRKGWSHRASAKTGCDYRAGIVFRRGLKSRLPPQQDREKSYGNPARIPGAGGLTIANIAKINYIVNILL